MDVRRVRTAKRRKEEKLAERNQIHLERVLGLTILTNAGLACSPTTGTIAYPAGCTVVLYNARKNRQSHITNPSRKTFTTLDFSEDGRYLVTGECGHQPHVRVWDVHDKSLVCEFPGHKYGINCVSFAPNGKYVVSVGSQHDMIVNVWDWKGNVKVASNKISAKVKAVSFAENGNYFVTAGNRHVKFWYLEYSRSKYQEPTPLTGRSAILGEQRNNYFCDVACGRGDMGDSTFAITKSGLLCEFNNRRLLDKWVELRTTSANCLTVGDDFIFIGCADGIVRCFSPHTLQFITTLPRTHYLGVDVSKGLTINHMASHPANAKYPDATAITFDKSNCKVTVIYNDHSIYVWDVRTIEKVGKSQSFLFHSACIWGLEMYPDQPTPSVLPQGSFITCSSDDTIRIWNMNSNMANNTVYRRNIYSEELLKMIYIDQELEFIKDADPCKMDTDQKETNTVYDQRNGVRCIRISPDGKHLASGDRAGNIRIHELQFMDEMCKIEAHDAEVLCLEYSEQVPVPTTKKAKSLLASASRDRLIHVFNATMDYGFLHTLDDHSSSITAVRFLKNDDERLQMISCGADKSIIFRDISLDEKGQPDFQRSNHIVGKTTLYDMEIDHANQQILTACQDRNIRVYTVDSGKHSKTFKGSQSEDGTLIKVVLDSSGHYAATSCTDKTLAIYDYMTGEVAATMFGHSELVTGLRFTNDCKHLISVSGDGCVFIWRLPVSMTANMLNKLSFKNVATDNNNSIDNRVLFDNRPQSLPIQPVATKNGNEDDYGFNVGQLPDWAKKQMGEKTATNVDDSSTKPKGRWAHKVPMETAAGDKKANGSKENSLEVGQTLPGRKGFNEDYLNDEDYNSMSEIELNRPGYSPFQSVLKSNGSSFRNNRVAQLKVTDADSSLGSLNVESTTEHDGDIDEYSDGLTTHDDGGESTEPEHPERTLFFGQQHEPAAPGEFAVNAMDVEELKRHRRVKELSRGRNARAKSDPSEASDFDEDDVASTPSADNAERNITSLMSVSSENVDVVGRREQFMRSNFDSLSAAEPSQKDGDDPQKTTNAQSISNRYREAGSSAVQRNASTIARAQSFRDHEQNQRREQLQKRIEETRRKLQEIGYRSMMRGSQSISDLTNATDTSQFMPSQGMASRPTSTEPPRHQSRPDPTPSNDHSKNTSNNNNNLRRVCSLSDLTRSGGNSQRRLLPAPPISVSGKKTPTASAPSKYKKTSRTENITSPTTEDVPSYMRSTSASTKKERAAVPLTPLGGLRIRPSQQQTIISQAQSTTDLRQPPLMQVDDSSSEEDNSSLSSSRRRSSSHDRRSSMTRLAGNSRNKLGNPGLARSERDLTKVTKVRVRAGSISTSKDESFGPGLTKQPRPKMKTTTMIVNSEDARAANPAVDVLHDPLDWRLVEQTRMNVQEASDNLVQLYKRISLDHSLEENMRVRFLQDLMGTAEIAQTILRPINPGINRQKTINLSESSSALAPNKGPSWC